MCYIAVSPNKLASVLVYRQAAMLCSIFWAVHKVDRVDALFILACTTYALLLLQHVPYPAGYAQHSSGDNLCYETTATAL